MKYVKWLAGLYILFTYPAWATKDSIKIVAALEDCHLEKSVPASTDYYADNSSNLYYGKYDATYDSMAVGLMFRSIPIAAGSTIDSVSLYLFSTGTYTIDSLRTEIKMEKSANPVAFLTRGGGGLADFQGRTRTTAHKDTVFGHSTFAYYRVGGDFKSVFQEVIDAGTWTNGDNVVVFLNNRGSDVGAYRAFYSYETSAANAAYMLIYSTAGGGSPAVDSARTQMHSPNGIKTQHSPSGIGASHKP
jgi:hypothetical protein